MSLGESLDFCDISARVFVRSTSESRPSSAESRRTDMCWTDELWDSVVDVDEGDSMDGMCGARNERAGC